jgi:predicted deacylase
MTERRRSRIFCEIDLDAPGKQTGFLRLMHSTHASAYGWIPIPIACIANGSGPTVLLSAGIHGDEYEGQLTLGRLIRELDPARVQGRIIVLPAANFPAAMAGRRTSPIDEGNLNRSFPGHPDGTITQQIAHHIESTLIPMAQAVVDLHSGGSSLMYVPSALIRRSRDPARQEKLLALLRAFASPVSHIVAEPQGEDRTVTGAAERQGVLCIGTELGGGGHATPAALRIAERGVAGVLRHLGVADIPVPEGPAPGPSRILEVGGPDYFVYAPEPGVFEPLVELGDIVRAGQPAGLVHHTGTPWREPVPVTFARDGFVLVKRWPGRTERGDCLFHLGTDTGL